MDTETLSSESDDSLVWQGDSESSPSSFGKNTPIKPAWRRRFDDEVVKNTASTCPQEMVNKDHLIECTHGEPDVIICVQNHRFPAHRVVLSAAVPYFKQMFSHDKWRESQQKEILLHGMSFGAISLILRYVYNGKLHIPGQFSAQLLLVADFLQMDEVVARTLAFLRVNLCDENVFTLLHLCSSDLTNSRFNLGQNLLENVHRYINKNFDTAYKGDDWLISDAVLVKNILSSDELMVKTEQVRERSTVSDLPKVLFAQIGASEYCTILSFILSNPQMYFAFERWLNYDPQIRHQYLVAYLSLIRLSFLPVPFISDQIYTNATISESIEARELVDRFLDSRIVQQGENLALPPGQLRNYGGYMCGRIYVVGGLRDLSGHSPMETFNVYEGKWNLLAPMLSLRSKSGVVELDGLIYVIGGLNQDRRLCTVECYNIKTKTWKRLSNLNFPVSHMGVCVFGKRIYVMGGTNDCSDVATVQTYDPANDAWTNGIPMLQPRSKMALTVCNRKIYVFGGTSNGETTNDSLIFDLDLLKWMEFVPLPNIVHSLAATTIDDYIWIAGGMNFDSSNDPMTTVFNSLYCIEGRYGGNKWTKKADMNLSRFGLSLVTADKKLFAVGGCDYRKNAMSKQTLTPTKSVEIYTPETNVWELCSSMIAHMGYTSATSAVVIPSVNDM